MMLLRASSAQSPPPNPTPRTPQPSTTPKPPTLQLLDRTPNHPKTLNLKLESKTKPKPKSKASQTKFKPAQVPDIYQILKSPVLTEAAMNQMINNNTLVFKVDVRANKTAIKDAVDRLYGVRSQSVNTLINADGRSKKAFVKLGSEYSAVDLATKTGML